MNIDTNREYKVLDKGYIKVRNYKSSDADIVAAARISYSGPNNKMSSTDEQLIRYLFRHEHMTPFEIPVIEFEVCCPIFVARQWMRHRTSSFNEISGRYSELDMSYYLPESIKVQSKTNKQGSGDIHEKDYFWRMIFDGKMSRSQEDYKSSLVDNVSKEQARVILPLSTYTKFVWQVNLRNLFHFVKLRSDHHAQEEIRVYSDVIKNEILQNWVPIAYKAFLDYDFNAVKFSAPEMEILLGLLANKNNSEAKPNLSKRELKDFSNKIENIYSFD